LITTETGAKKIEDSDNWREIFDAHNESVDALNSNIAKLVQESAFEIKVENNEFVLYWYGAEGECPYSIVLENGAYALYFNYTT